MIAHLAALFTIFAILGLIGYGTVALARWARRTGRRPWLWILGAYVAANVVWTILRPLITP